MHVLTLTHTHKRLIAVHRAATPWTGEAAKDQRLTVCVLLWLVDLGSEKLLRRLKKSVTSVWEPLVDQPQRSSCEEVQSIHSGTRNLGARYLP